MSAMLGPDWNFSSARCAYVRKLQLLVGRFPNVPREQIKVSFEEAGNDVVMASATLSPLDHLAAARRGAFGSRSAAQLCDLPPKEVAIALAALTPNERACTLVAMPAESRAFALQASSAEHRSETLLAMPLGLRGEMAEEFGKLIAPALLASRNMTESLAVISPVDRAAALSSMSPQDEAIALGVMSYKDRAASLAVIVETLSPGGRGPRLAIMTPEERASMLVAMPAEERAATIAALTDEQMAATMEPMLWCGALPGLESCRDELEEPRSPDTRCRGSCVYCTEPVMDDQERMRSRSGYAHLQCVEQRRGKDHDALSSLSPTSSSLSRQTIETVLEFE